MLKLLIKLALAALVANAAYRLGTAYLSYYRFTDAVAQTAQFVGLGALGLERSGTVLIMLIIGGVGRW